MAVPPPSLTISCWQSLQERRSPAFSRVRAASASSTARWPGEERKERGRWRQASRMAVARSRWLGQASASPAGTRGACGHCAEPAGPRALPRGLHVDAFARPLHRPARQVPAPSRGHGRGGDKNVAGITRLVFRGGGEMRPLGLALGPVLPPWLLPWGVPGPTPTRPHSAPSWATRLVEPWPPLLPTALPGWAGPARGLRGRGAGGLTRLGVLGAAPPQAVLQQLVGARGAGACHQAHGGFVQEHLGRCSGDSVKPWGPSCVSQSAQVPLPAAAHLPPDTRSPLHSTPACSPPLFSNPIQSGSGGQARVSSFLKLSRFFYTLTL